MFSLSSTYSYVSIPFSFRFNVIFNGLYAPIYVPTPFGESLVVTHVDRAYSVIFIGLQTWNELVILDMTDFDVILYMT